MQKVKIRIDAHDALVWSIKHEFPSKDSLQNDLRDLALNNQQMRDFILRMETPTMEIEKSLFDEYLQACDNFYTLMNKIEQLYRIQEGKEPYAETPEHTIISQE